MAKNDNAQSDSGGKDEDEVKKQFDFMMSDVLKERKKHILASLHYNKFRILQIRVSYMEINASSRIYLRRGLCSVPRT